MLHMRSISAERPPTPMPGDERVLNTCIRLTLEIALATHKTKMQAERDVTYMITHSFKSVCVLCPFEILDDEFVYWRVVVRFCGVYHEVALANEL